MATVSGRLLFDASRTANPPSGMSGIANVPVVLQDTLSGDMLAVMTDVGGNFSFQNVPNSSYRIVEAYGIPGVATPGDFNTAVVGDIPVAAVPPISYAPSPPAGATDLDCTTPNTLLITVSGSNISNEYICNAPVRYSSIVLDPVVNVDWSTNIINAANMGTFGEFAPGTHVMTGANPNPYPGVNPDFDYVLPANGSPNPSDGQYTIQNIATGITYQNNNVWWRIADVNTGNETGRMMIVNGANTNAVFFQDVVFVKPNTYYLFMTWILNLVKVTGRVDPELGVRIIAPDGMVLFDENIGATIPINQNEPEWHEIGTIIKSGNFSTLTVQFVSLGEAASGNDYVVDNIGLYEVGIPLYAPVKSASATDVKVGDIVTFTVTFTNASDLPMTNVSFNDPIPEGFNFVPESVKIDNVSYETYDPNIGFALPDLAVTDEVVITFDAIATSVPWMGRAANTASVTYSSLLVMGVSPVSFTVPGNAVDINITNQPSPVSLAALQNRRDVAGTILQNSIVSINTSLLSKGAIVYQPSGTIDILQAGFFVVHWLVLGMAGFATDGQRYTLKKLDYETNTWGSPVSAGDHIKNSPTRGFAIVEVTSTEIGEYGKATIALYNGADSDAKLTFLLPNTSIIVWGANFANARVRVAEMDNALSQITTHIEDVVQFLGVSEVANILSQTPELEGLGISVISSGYNYNFWGFGELTAPQTLNVGGSYYLATNAQYPPLAYYQDDYTIGTLWIIQPTTSPLKYPLRFDGTGVYIIPSATLALAAGTKFLFTKTLIVTA